MMAAWAIWAVESGRSCLTRVARSSCISTAPATVPSTRTEPPLSGVPPTTTAVMAELHQGAERGRVAGGEPGGGEDAGQRREGAAEDVDAGQDAFDGESGEDGGLAVAADGDDLAAEGGAGDQEGRKQKGSKNRDKARLKVARAHAKVADARREFHHQLSTRLISENQGIAVEDLSVAGLARTRLAKSIRDAGWASFISTLEYKAQRYGRTLVKIGRFEPTSQTCSTCGVKDGPKPLHVREWTCRACGTVHDRDHNAAINVKVAADWRCLPAERR